MRSRAAAAIAAPALLVLAALLALGALACSADDDSDGSANSPGASSTPGEEDTQYLAALAGALASVNESLDELDQLRADAFDEGPDAAAADAYGAAFEAYTADRLAAIEALEPPQRLAVLHEALATAAEDARDFAEELSDEITASPPESQDEFLTLYFDLDGASIASRFTDACASLQADANAAVGIDLHCLP